MRKMLSDSILDLRKRHNRKTCTFTFMRFPPGALPEVQNWIWKHFSHKVLYTYYSKKKLECFGSYLTKWKNGFPIASINLARKCSGFFFKARNLIFFAKWRVLPTKHPWSSPKFWFWHHIFYIHIETIILFQKSKMEDYNVHWNICYYFIQLIYLTP